MLEITRTSYESVASSSNTRNIWNEFWKVCRCREMIYTAILFKTSSTIYRLWAPYLNTTFSHLNLPISIKLFNSTYLTPWLIKHISSTGWICNPSGYPVYSNHWRWFYLWCWLEFPCFSNFHFITKNSHSLPIPESEVFCMFAYLN